MKISPLIIGSYIVLCLSYATINHLSAQIVQKEKNSLIIIHLSETGLAALNKNPVIVKVYTQYMRSRESVDGQTLTLYPDSAGVCRFVLPLVKEGFWVSISPLLSPFGYQTRKLYLINPGDSVDIIRVNNSYRFTGKGSKKMQCQYQLFQLDERGLFMVGDPANDNRRIDFINSQQIKNDSVISLKKKIISQFSLAPLDKLIITTDAVAISELSRFNRLKTDLWFNAIDSIKLSAAHYLYRERFLHKSPPVPSTIAINNSACFTDALFARITTDIIAEQFQEGKLNPADRSVPLSQKIFWQIHRRINQEYKGYLKEKLLTTLYAESFYSSDSTDVLLLTEYRKLKDPHLKTILHQIADTKIRKQPVYDFALPDRNGVKVHLSDFRGKLVVLDFWFTGCTNCIKLTSDMHNIVERYRKDTGIVFINICADTDKNLWLESVASGKYTHPTSINLYTDGKGDESPIIRRYNYLGYPKLLLVSKNGELISADPPRPNSPENIRLFIDLIDKALQ